MEKTLEYFRTIDPPAEVVVQELAAQYEGLIDQAVNLISDSGASVNNGRQGNAASQRQLKEKDREIKRLKELVA